MTVPVTPAPAGNQPLRVDVTMEEMERGAKEAEEAAARTAAEAAEAAKREAAKAAAGDDPKLSSLREALRLSEESRQRLESDLRSARGATATSEVKEKEKELSQEELAELYEKKPLDAIAYMNARAVRTVEENFSRRIGALATSATTSAEDYARRKYPDEFKVFDREIREYVDSHPNKTVFGDPKTWDDFIAWMRGKPGNFEKLVEHRAEQSKSKQAADAQAVQAASAGVHTHSDQRTPTPRTGEVFDQTTKDIIKELAASGVLDGSDPEADYRKWMATGR